MYNVFRTSCERLLRIPPAPEPPPGDEATTKLFRAAPNYYRYLLCLWGLRSLVLILIIVAAAGIPLAAASLELLKKGNGWGYATAALDSLVLLGGALVSLFGLAVLKLDFEKRWYLVTDRSLRIREGVVTVREMTVNFANIQNISISQGPLQRVLGLADLRVDTAGGGGASQSHQRTPDLHTAWFRGIENADEVRQLITDRLRRLKDAGLGDPDDAARRLPVMASPANYSPALLEALRGVHRECQALRTAAGS